jgi:Ca-activated chloride channel homolog
MFSEFHFIRPLWLLGLIALPVLFWLIKRIRIKSSGWQQFLPKHLSTGIESTTFTASLTIPIALLAFILVILSLAGPTWKKLPQPVYQIAKGSVLIMDMSYSMYSTDLTPNRLTQARYKATDLLDVINDGEIGLIAYAGDAFTISPLTNDVENIKLLLPSLSPELMPELGSNPFAALDLAKQMLINAGHQDGDIYWFTDGVEDEEVMEIQDWSRAHQYRINILAVGTKSGAPIRLENGELMKDRIGGIIIPKVNIDELASISKVARGNFSTITTSNQDIESLAQESVALDQEKKEATEKEGDQWQDMGAYIVILIALLMLPLFRRGAILAVFPFSLLLLPAQPVNADLWSDLWKTKDQQGKALYQKEQFKQAANAFKDPMWQGNAHYKSGDYESAISAYSKINNADANYNIGNSYAQLQQLEKAIEAYEKALALNPEHENALANKKLIEDLQKQQESQQQQDQQNNDQQNNDQQNENQDQQQSDQQNSQDKQNGDNQDDQQEQQSNESANPDKQNLDQPKEGEEDQSQQSKQQEGSEEQQENQQQKPKQTEENQDSEAQSTQAQQQMQEQLDKEKEQKYQQIMNKVTDDPYLLLRNKMQLEYQKRRQNRSTLGDKKKW